MDARELRNRVESATETELGRLRSDKVLLAATGADISTGTVVAVIDATLGAYASSLEQWAGETEERGLAEAFETAAASVAAARDPFAGDDAIGAAPDRRLLAFGDPASARERAGAGLIAAPAIVDGLGLQAVSFFVNEADRERADRCRALRSTVTTLRDDAGASIEAVCDAEAAWAAVETGAIGAIEASYRVYVDVLGEMGLDPKPVC